MLAHLRTHFGYKPFKCEYCDKSFNEKGNLKTHTRIHTGERPFQCHQCCKAFKAFGQLRDHQMSHLDIKPFECNICHKQYRRKEILKNHLLIHNKEACISNTFNNAITSKNNDPTTISLNSIKPTTSTDNDKSNSFITSSMVQTVLSNTSLCSFNESHGLLSFDLFDQKDKEENVFSFSSLSNDDDNIIMHAINHENNLMFDFNMNSNFNDDYM